MAVVAHVFRPGLADRLGVEAPILRELRRVLFEGAPIQDAVESLLTRPYRGEE